MSTMSRGKKRTIQFRRRVPARYRSVEPREVFWLSLHTDSAEEGKSKGEQVWRTQIQAWEAMLAGETTIAEDRIAAARELAQAKGFS